jgi:hypothetical protein
MLRRSLGHKVAKRADQKERKANGREYCNESDKRGVLEIPEFSPD